MTGGGDLGEVRHDELEETLDELGGTAEGEADAPVEYGGAVNENVGPWKTCSNFGNSASACCAHASVGIFGRFEPIARWSET